MRILKETILDQEIKNSSLLKNLSYDEKLSYDENFFLFFSKKIWCFFFYLNELYLFF